MFQKIKFFLIAFMLNPEQKANLAATLLRRSNYTKSTRQELYETVKRENNVPNNKLMWLIWDAAAFGPEDK